MGLRAYNLLTFFVAVFITTAGQINAQESNSILLADLIELDAQGNLVAQGNVDIVYKDQRLKAPKVVYIKDKNILIMDMGATLTDKNGSHFIAETAELDRQLLNGIIKGANLVLEQQIQMRADTLERKGGLNSNLTTVRATACFSCKNPVPIWQIRAKSGLHDIEKQQLIFQDAHLRIFDIPVFYVPYLRLPEPGVKRMRGFLVPRTKQNSLLGLGLELPYFIPMGQDKDTTVSPLISQETNTLKFTYRQAFDAGRIVADLAASWDTVNTDKIRGRFQSDGDFNLPLNYRLHYDFTMVSDDNYINDYDYPPLDRIASRININKTQKRQHEEANLVYYHSLFYDYGVLPAIINFNHFDRYFKIPAFEGDFKISAILHNNFRSSTKNRYGRDIRRLNTSFGWSDSFNVNQGIRIELGTQVRFDSYLTRQDTSFKNEENTVSADGLIMARWPMIRRDTLQHQDILEPVLQLAFSKQDDLKLPLEESTHSELDEGNLISLSRFPAHDRFEKDGRGTIGLRWLRQFKSGSKLDISLGQVFRQNQDEDFNAGSGLSGKVSDLLLSAGYTGQNGLSISGRTLLDHNISPNRAEALATFAWDRVSLSTGFSFLPTSIEQERKSDISELRLTTVYQFDDDWRYTAGVRYDLPNDRTAEVSIGILFDNECTNVKFSAKRRFSNSGSSSSVTSWDLTTSLKGFSTGGNRSPSVKDCKE
ncbi:MAG: LPS assembly protein LptD [Paracoccaceae bacterium]|nr:LPS assembly protein LptD [Paracoccaceae bacterium]